MSSNPYENEPGFENANAEHDKENMKVYCLKVSPFWLLQISDWLDTNHCDINRFGMKH
jgi:hypothetical protein